MKKQYLVSYTKIDNNGGSQTKYEAPEHDSYMLFLASTYPDFKLYNFTKINQKETASIIGEIEARYRQEKDDEERETAIKQIEDIKKSFPDLPAIQSPRKKK